jgi:hypothetical protein
MSTWLDRGASGGPAGASRQKKNQPKTNSPNRLTHRNPDGPALVPRVNTEFDLPPAAMEAFHKLCDTFAKMSSSRRIWDTVRESLLSKNTHLMLYIAR